MMDADRDTIFTAEYLDAGEPQESTVRPVSLASLSMLAKLHNPMRYLYLGNIEKAQVILAEDLPCILEYVWLHVAPVNTVRELVLNGTQEAVQRAVYDWAENLTMEQLQRYVEALEADVTRVQLARAEVIPTPGKGDPSKNVQSQH